MNGNASTISADIISFTALVPEDRELLQTKLQNLLGVLSERYASEGFFGRMVQGDYIECGMLSPRYALRVALMLKSYIKSLELGNNDEPRIRLFRTYGMRVAIAVAPLTELNAEKGIIDGEAIYLSGRTIQHLSTSDKKKVVIKETMYFRSADEEVQERFDTLVNLLDALLSACSPKQCEVLYYKLSGMTEKEICAQTGKNQSTVSQHSSAARWNSIEKSLLYFEKYIL